MKEKWKGCLRHATVTHSRSLLCHLTLTEGLKREQKQMRISTGRRENHIQYPNQRVLTLRYFVRSYVTKPTTMRAITDIPANTPRPIGNTDNFVPGIWKAAALEVVESAAEVPEGELAAAAAGETVLGAVWEAEAAAPDALAA